MKPGNLTLVADVEKRMVGCVLIQAMAGCPSTVLYDLGFDTATWQIQPEPGQRKISGTVEQWKKYAAICNAAHVKKRESVRGA